jgi:arsenate reductase
VSDGGAPHHDRPVVLFLCTHNAGRSLAARVLLDHYAGGRIDVRSAGSEPAEQLNPAVVAVLRERGVDTSGEHPKLLTEGDALEADVVVTMGCGDTCPVVPGKRYLDWDLSDPAGQPVDVVRPIVEDIDRRVRALLADLVAPPAPPAPVAGHVPGGGLEPPTSGSKGRRSAD